jgi:hypothetical protein
MPGSSAAAEWPSSDALAAEVEIVELRHVERPIRGFVARLVFVVMIAAFAGLIVINGLPGRSDFSLNSPLLNLLAPVTAP